jgi:hypothetical protein
VWFRVLGLGFGMECKVTGFIYGVLDLGFRV